MTSLDKELVRRTREDAEALRVRTLFNAAQMNHAGDNLDDFAHGLKDLMAGHLGQAMAELETREHQADMDPKGRPENVRVKTEAPR